MIENYQTVQNDDSYDNNNNEDEDDQCDAELSKNYCQPKMLSENKENIKYHLNNRTEPSQSLDK